VGYEIDSVEELRGEKGRLNVNELLQVKCTKLETTLY